MQKIQLLYEIDKLDNIYDLFALCCSYIFWEIPKKPYDFQAFDDRKYEEVDDFIIEYMMDRENQGEFFAFDVLKENIKNFFGTKVDIEKCFAIVQFIDERIECEICDGFVKKQNIIQYESLSDRYYNKVRIIPRLKQSFIETGNLLYKQKTKDNYNLFRDTHEYPCSELDKTTVNYTICDEEFINKYPFCIHRLTEKHPISIHFKERKKIVIAIFPFTKVKIENLLEVCLEKKVFHVKDMSDSVKECLSYRYASIYKKCIGKDIDFLIFPEMLISESFLNQVKIQQGAPQIIINGSIWENLSNKSIITDGNMKEIFSYFKKESFVHKIDGKSYKEHLDTTKNKNYELLEIPEIGRVGVCICKDLISEVVKRFHKSLGTSLLIVPAHTASNDLQSSARNLSEEFNCVVVVANSCSSISSKNNFQKGIGFLTLPAKNTSSRTCLIKEYEKTECVNNCEKECCGKIFSICFDKIEQYSEGMSFKVDEWTL